MKETAFDAANKELAELREENRLLHEHIEASEQANTISRELVISQFQEVERVLALLEQENELRKGILDAANQISIIYCDTHGLIQLFNRGAEVLLGYRAGEMVGRMSIQSLHRADELLLAMGEGKETVDGEGLSSLISRIVGGRLPAKEWVYVARDGREIPVNLSFSAVHTPEGKVAGLMCAAMDISAIKAAHAELRSKNDELGVLLGELQHTQQQLLQSEKMASLGQLAAGVAHEINNPIGFVNSNLGTLGSYLEQLLAIVRAYEPAVTLIRADSALFEHIEATRRAADVEFLAEDAPALLKESLDGLIRVKKIVDDLRTFSRMGETSWRGDDINAGLDSTMNIVANELRYCAKVERDFAVLPEVECVIAQLNQVFVNVLVNAAQAMKEPGIIRVTTRCVGEGHVQVEISDTGNGIGPEHLKHIFDPFFTTKPVGKGTGLGLSISYGIIEKHHGRFEVESTVGVGTTFRITLPVRQPEAA